MGVFNNAQLLVLVIVTCLSAFALMTDDQFYVAAPALACVALFLCLWLTLWRRDKKIPLFDVGVFCALATLIYTVYPIVNFWADGLRFGPFSDLRLQSYNISPAEMGFFHLRHVLYLFSFVLVYSRVRGGGDMGTGNVNMPNRSARDVIVFYFALLTGYLYILQLYTGASFYGSYESDAYAENIAAFGSLPLVLLQVSIKFWGILFLFKLALLLIVVGRCRQKKWLIILLVWIAVEVIQVVYIKGARTGLVLFLMAVGLLYHRMIKPLTMKVLLACGAILLTGFIFLGVYRSYYDVSEMRSELSRSNAGMFSGNNEFQVLLGTAYDVLKRKEDGAVLPWYLYINDFITILPPQQILPFTKVPACEWYLNEIGLGGAGVGLMWGVITQSIVGFDWLELAVRGALLGYILARIHRWYLRRQSGFLETMLYMFLCLKVYYTFRDSTFYPLSNLVWEVLPFYLLLRIGTATLSSATGHASNRGTGLFFDATK